MDLLTKLAVLALSAGLIMFAVRFLLVPGIDRASQALNFSNKTRGQILGYATSAPELVIVASSAASGVYAAGFWNIASSNIINWALFLAAVIACRQYQDLNKKTFLEELGFGLLSVILPVILYRSEIQSSVLLGVALLVVFALYKILDRKLNTSVTVEKKGGHGNRNLQYGLFGASIGTLIIIVAGWHLGSIAENLVVELEVPAWMIGWILGIISSLPEMRGFFEIFRKHKKADTLEGIEDTQEALDALVASNMSNLGIILPVGIFIAALM